MNDNNLQEATFGTGCFWCTEAVFSHLEGVTEVVPGYSGGHVKNPSYREVCNGVTGHAEVLRIGFDPEVISYAKLLEVFFQTHDPTTLNRQGGDVGEQYRSVIFYHNEEQMELAAKAVRAAEDSDSWKDPIVTAVEPLENFYPAEEEHKKYYDRNSDQPYCQVVINPKLSKFKSEFSELLKTSSEG